MAQSTQGIEAGDGTLKLIRSTVEADTIADTSIRKLIIERIETIADDSPFETTVHGYFLMVESGDTLEAINLLVGFDVLSKPVEILESHESCWSALYIIDDSGYGIELFITKADDIDCMLTTWLKTHALPRVGN